MSANQTHSIGGMRRIDAGSCWKTAWLIFLAAMVCGLAQVGVARAQVEGDVRVAAVVSLRIRPYMDAVQGVSAHFQEIAFAHLDIFFLEPEMDEGYSRLTQTLKNKPFDLMIAIGPEAMDYIWTTYPDPQVAKLFCMVLNPIRVAPQPSRLCGVSLDIPAATQLREFAKRLPTLKRLGLIFDPANNADFAASAKTAAQSMGIDLVELKVGARSEMLALVQDRLQQIDALWMIPDRTVVSESLVPFIIKEAMSKNVAVFGYNRFFSDSGAAISLVRDYQAIGYQAAAMALEVLAHHRCRLEPPRFNTLINTQVLKKLGYSDAQDQNRGDGSGRP